jgi:hypothetical protein
MKKRMLDPSHLEVQSFVAAARAAGRPVHAGQATVTVSIPRCGTVVRSASCYSGCTDPEVC